MNAALAWLSTGAALLFLPLGGVVAAPRRRAAARVRPGSAEAVDRGPAASPRRRSAGTGGLVIAVVSVGVLCLAALGLRTGVPVAALGCPTAALSLRWLQRRAVRADPDRSLALTLDLSAAALRSGRPLADALTLAAPAGHTEVATALRRVAGLSRLGADPVQAWSAVPRDGPLGDVSVVAVRSAASGIKLAGAFERMAAEIRAERAAAAAVRAHRAGVVAMAPLAACFLPSFVCLGVIPVVVGIARSAFAVMP
jgi:Flp pilus assembly protein TadB